MKANGSLVVMGFLVVGIWYGIGYVQGQDSAQLATVDELQREYEKGYNNGVMAKPTAEEAT